MDELRIGATLLRVVVADITTLDTDAIVNAANEALAPGGGVCGAIHRAAGPDLAAECARVAPSPTGEARITGGHRLPARRIIHAVGPVWQGGGRGEAAELAGAYRNALTLAAGNAVRTIAFPAISTGIYGYPAAAAAAIAVGTAAGFARSAPGALAEIVFCCFSEASADEHRRALDAEAAASGHARG
ncbi:macro domain-containing protein [Faunimonas sp. B44]|uniref:macro domain-containing protein n=1 Tax=Faunimonas sp. B44 TaxID=3461493 RepID=UPI004043E9C3